MKPVVLPDHRQPELLATAVTVTPSRGVRALLGWIVNRLEEAFSPIHDRESMRLSKATLYDLNARAERNYWFDKKGTKWPLRDSL
jgi:hypothetical protein